MKQAKREVAIAAHASVIEDHAVENVEELSAFVLAASQ